MFLADFDGDGTPEAVAPNKAAQNPGAEDFKKKTPISVFKRVGGSLAEDGWREIVLGTYSVPQNSEPVDLDGDGDMDVVGTRGNSAPYDGVFWLEQVRSDAPAPAFQRARSTDSAEMPLP